MRTIQEYICEKELSNRFGEVILFKGDLLQNHPDNTLFFRLVKEDIDNITVYFMDRDDDYLGDIQLNPVKNKFKWLIDNGYIKFNKDIPYTETKHFQRDLENIKERIDNQRAVIKKSNDYLEALLEEYYNLTKDIVNEDENVK